MDLLEINYDTLRKQGTGSSDILSDSIVVEVPFDRYLIKIRLSQANEFIGIEEISVNKNFLSQTQKLIALSSPVFHEIDKFYQEEEQ